MLSAVTCIGRAQYDWVSMLTFNLQAFLHFPFQYSSFTSLHKQVMSVAAFKAYRSHVYLKYVSMEISINKHIKPILYIYQLLLSERQCSGFGGYTDITVKL